MTRQLALPMPTQAPASQSQKLRIWEAIVELRKRGFQVYRAGRFHALASGHQGQHRRERILTTSQLLQFATQHYRDVVMS